MTMFSLQGAFLCTLLYLLLSTPYASAEDCEYEDCLGFGGPVVGNPDKTLRPLPTPRNKVTNVSPTGSGLIQSIGCTNPGVSLSGIDDCPEGDKASGVEISNNGRIDIRVYFIDTNGSNHFKFTVSPGQNLPVAGPTCIGHQWMIQSTCGDCMAVFRVISKEPEMVTISNDGIEATCPGPFGQWSPIRNWNNDVIAAGIANIPGTNKVLGFSSIQEGSFSRKLPVTVPLNESQRTQVEIYDYFEDTFTENDLIGHNMFCAALTLLPDGKLFAQGGGRSVDGRLVSTYDPFEGLNGKWEQAKYQKTNNGHWYGTVVVTKEQRLLLALGVDSASVGFKSWSRVLDFPEISQGLDLSKPWGNMTGVDMDGKQPANLHWYPVLHLMPNGDILESGTMNNMWKINTDGTGAIDFAGKRNTVREENEAWGASTIMFEQGKLLTTGGIENWSSNKSPGRFVYKRAIVIDMNNASNIQTTRTSDMSYQRAFVNTVVLPSGDVLAIGGKNNILQWDDSNSVKFVELWNPSTGKWTVLAEQKAPRNYHATAILLRDGRVLSAGGGLCGNCHKVNKDGFKLNQPTSEIFSPPYLFDSDGLLKQRPVLQRVTPVAHPGHKLRVVVSGPAASTIQRISIVKQCAVTHTISTDARQLELKIIRKIRLSSEKYIYKVSTPTNGNVMNPGYWFVFVFDSTGTPSVAKDLHVVLHSVQTPSG